MHTSRETKKMKKWVIDPKEKAKVLQHFNVAPVYKTNATLHSLLESGSMCNVLTYICFHNLIIASFKHVIIKR